VYLGHQLIPSAEIAQWANVMATLFDKAAKRIAQDEPLG
jgi:hypothetical protein